MRSPIFARAPSLSRLLSYLVEQTFAGHRSAVTEYSLGVDVFDRGESFDPTTDTIVRVQARRLRSKLQQYYTAEGQQDPVIIELPKGSYEVVLRLAGSDLQLCGQGDQVHQQLRIGLAPPVPLPVACSSFVGREDELTDVKRLLRSERLRLLTLTGAGGSGKTRLALQATAGLGATFPGGIYMVSLASVTDTETVASTIAHTVGLRHTGGRPLAEALQQYVATSVSAPVLFLLDNFEQVTEAAPLLTLLLRTSPQLKLLVTSRSLLDISGEHEYPVPPFPKPDAGQVLSPAELARNPAVALFVQRAQSLNPGFVLNDGNARDVAGICARLDGLPLAIELAAPWVKILSPAALLARLNNSLDLLTSGYRDLPVRQQTLRTAIDWSYGLLTSAEQMLFRRMAVLAGGCTLESVEAVCNAQRDLEVGVVEGILSLVKKNLIQREVERNEESRFTMLQTIREYALEQLQANGEAELVRRAHAAYCIVLAEEGAAQVTEDDRARWLSVWNAEHENLRCALDWLIDTDRGAWALRLGTALFAFWQRSEHLAEGRDRLQSILRLKTASPTSLRARAAWYAAIFADQQGDFASALRLHQESLRMYEEMSDQQGIAAQLGYIGQELHQTGRKVEARKFFESSVAACRQLGDRAASPWPSTISRSSSRRNASIRSPALFSKRRWPSFRELHNENGAAWSLNHLGDIAFYRARLRRCTRPLPRSIRCVSAAWGSVGHCEVVHRSG